MIKNLKKVKILMYDIETLPNIAFTWGMWKQNVPGMNFIKDKNVICISYKWLHENKVKTISIGDDPKTYNKDAYLGGVDVVKKFLPIMREADFLVAHNGDKFDYGHIKAISVMNGLDPINVRSVDTLKMARGIGMFPHGNRLDDLAEVLGVSKKHHTSMDMWRDIALYSSRPALTKMETYCEQDVRVLEEVFLKLWPHSERVLPNIHTLIGGDKEVAGCTRCGSENNHKDGRYIKNVLVFQRYVCKDCGANFIGRTAIDVKT